MSLPTCRSRPEDRRCLPQYCSKGGRRLRPGTRQSGGDRVGRALGLVQLEAQLRGWIDAEPRTVGEGHVGLALRPGAELSARIDIETARRGDPLTLRVGT